MKQPRVDPVQRVTNTWVTRAQILAQQNGITPKQFNKKIAPLVKQDIKKVRQGGQAMSNAEALNASMYNLYGQAAIKAPKKDTGISPKTLIENAVTDIKDITMNAIPGVVDFVGDTVIPKNLMKGPGEWELPPVIDRTVNLYVHANDPKWLKAHGYDPKIAEESLAGAAAGLRAAGRPETMPGGKGEKAEAQKPSLWSIIPGVMTAANLTDKEGRAAITGRPIMTTLDVLPVAAGATKVAAAGAKAAEVGGALGKLAEAGERGTRLGSVVEAAGEGKPLKTAYRAAVPEETRKLIANNVTEFTEKRLGVSPTLSHITRVFSITDRMNSRRVEAWMKKHPVIDEMMKLPEEEQRLIQDMAVNPNKYVEVGEPIETTQTVRSVAGALGGSERPIRIVGDDPYVDLPAGHIRLFRGENPNIDLGGGTTSGRNWTVNPKFARSFAGENGNVNFVDVPIDEAHLWGVGGDPSYGEQTAESVMKAQREGGELTTNYVESAPIQSREVKTYEPGPTRSTIDAERKAIIDQLDNAATEILNKRAGARNLKIRGHNVWYAGDSMVTRLYDRLNSTQKARTSAQVRYNDFARRAMDRHMSKWTKAIDRAIAGEKKHWAPVAALDKKIQNLESTLQVRRALGRSTIALENQIDAARSAKTRALRPLNKARAELEDARLHIKNAYREVNVDNKQVASARARRDQLFRTQERLTKELDASVDKIPPAEYMPMLQNEQNQRLYNAILEKDPALADDLGEAAVALGYTEEQYLKYMTKEEYDAIWREVATTWTKLADEGHKPIWVHPYDRVEISQALRRTPLPARVNNITRLRHSIEDQAPSMTPIAVALTAAAYENILHDGSKMFIQNAIKPHKMTYDEVKDWATKRYERESRRGKHKGIDPIVARNHLISEHFRTWTPENPFRFTEPKLTPENILEGNLQFVPKTHADTIDKLSHPYAKTEVGRFAEKAQRIFKASVLTFSLKHLADEFFGGMIYMAARGHLDTWASFPKAWRMVVDGKMPVEIPTQIELTGAVWQNKMGNTAGRLYQEAGGKIWQLKEYINNVYRAMDYLGEKSFLKRTQGLSTEVAHARALQHTYKAMMDLDSMTPMQRSLLRQAFPFYSFIRYSLKYVLTYPTDYPVRAAILSKLAKIEEEDYSSGLPQIFNQLFQIGGPNEAGDELMLDTKVMNPFRDMGNYFTLTGFIGSFTPVAQIPLQAMGVDTMAGAAELYPQLTVDPKTGSIQAKRPSGSLGKGIEAFIPETRALDYFLGLSDDMRDLKKRDKRAFNNKFWDIFMVPFAPKRYNTAEQRGKLAQNWVTLAQQALANAEKYPERAGQYLKPYKGSNVPYEGHIVPTELVQNLIKQSSEVAPEGYDPRLLMPGIKAVKNSVTPIGVGAGLTPSSTLENLMRQGLLKPGATSGANK